MSEEILKKISNQLTLLIRIGMLKSDQNKFKINEILDLVKDMGLTDNEASLMFNVSAQALRNARSKKNRGSK